MRCYDKASYKKVLARGGPTAPQNGGGSTACYLGCGTVFQLAAPSGGGAWTETVLADLSKGAPSPTDSILAFRNGLLYGTTFYLGAHDVGSAFTLVP
jgi:hypothetical protein